MLSRDEMVVKRQGIHTTGAGKPAVAEEQLQITRLDFISVLLGNGTTHQAQWLFTYKL